MRFPHKREFRVMCKINGYAKIKHRGRIRGGQIVLTDKKIAGNKY